MTYSEVKQMGFNWGAALCGIWFSLFYREIRFTFAFLALSFVMNISYLFFIPGFLGYIGLTVYFGSKGYEIMWNECKDPETLTKKQLKKRSLPWLIIGLAYHISYFVISIIVNL